MLIALRSSDWRAPCARDFYKIDIKSVAPTKASGVNYSDRLGDVASKPLFEEIAGTVDPCEQLRPDKHATNIQAVEAPGARINRRSECRVV